MTALNSDQWHHQPASNQTDWSSHDVPEKCRKRLINHLKSGFYLLTFQINQLIVQIISRSIWFWLRSQGRIISRIRSEISLITAGSDLKSAWSQSDQIWNQPDHSFITFWSESSFSQFSFRFLWDEWLKEETNTELLLKIFWLDSLDSCSDLIVCIQDGNQQLSELHWLKVNKRSFSFSLFSVILSDSI